MVLLTKVLLVLAQCLFQLFIVLCLVRTRLLQGAGWLKEIGWRALLALVPPRVYRVPLLPGHVALAILEDSVHLDSVVEIVLVLGQIGIRRITLYDPRGKMKEMVHDLKQALRDKAPRRSIMSPSLFPSTLSPKQIRFNTTIPSHSRDNYNNNSDREEDNEDDIDDSAIDSSECKRAVIADNEPATPSSNSPVSTTVDLTIFSQEDGRSVIVEVAKGLAGDMMPGPGLTTSGMMANRTVGGQPGGSAKLQPGDVCPALITTRLEYMGHAEPDFIMKFGEVDSMCGYPLWSMRVTEILPYRTHVGFGARGVMDALDSFGNRNQRFGR